MIDFTENGKTEQGNPLLEANPGGAPCNVLAMLSKLGHKTAFVGKVGADMFGQQLEHALVGAGVGIEGLMKDERVNTTLAFVHNQPDGEREFSFYRNPGADMMLTQEEVCEKRELIGDCKVFHFGSLSMTHEECRQATKAAVEMAKAAGALISFDPNLREPLWDSLEEARTQIGWGLSNSDIVKIADNEIVWFLKSDTYKMDCKEVDGETTDCKKADFTKHYFELGKQLLSQYPNIQLLLVSLGNQGSMALMGDLCVTADAYLRPDTMETTGAGDTFCGCVLHYVLEQGFRAYNADELKKMITLANVAAALITTRKGALAAMPDMNEILNAYLAGKVQGKKPGQCKKHPMHLCQHTGEEMCQFHKREKTDLYVQ